MMDNYALVYDLIEEAEARQAQLDADGNYPRMASKDDQYGNGTQVPLNQAGTYHSTYILLDHSTGKFGLVVDGDGVRATAARYNTPNPVDFLTPAEKASLVVVDASWFDGPKEGDTDVGMGGITNG